MSKVNKVEIPKKTEGLEFLECININTDNTSESVCQIKFELILSKKKRKILELFEDAAEDHAKDMKKSLKMTEELSKTGATDISDLPIDLRLALHQRFIMCGYGGVHEGCGKCKETLFATPKLFHEHVAKERKLKAEAIEDGEEDDNE